MYKKFLLFLLVPAFLPLTLLADWVPLNASKSTKAPPAVSILSQDQTGTVLQIELTGFEMNDFTSDGTTYQTLSLLDEIYTNETGSPELPYLSKILAVPGQSAVSVEVLETGEKQTFSGIHLRPARASWQEGDPETAFEKDLSVYTSPEAFPKAAAKVDPPAVFRDFRIARVSVFPIRYFPAEQKVEVVSSITVKVKYDSGEAINPKTKAQTPIPPSFGKLYRSFIFNYQEVLDQLYGGKEAGHELMLCIMPDDFEESFEVYAEWKRQSGIDIHVTLFSDINATSTNPQIIKTHITDAYNNWDVPPTYVLIVGDEGVFPHKMVTYDYTFPNEDYFVEIEGNDHFPEMMIGRFTNQGDYRLQVMVNKFIMYEKTPYTEETDWFKSGLCCSNNAYASQVQTKRFAAERMEVDGGFDVDTLMSDGSGWWGGDCSMDLQDVIAALDEGKSFLNYRGEGWYSGWTANCYNFESYNVSSLNNGEKFTFITSIGCGVAGFQSFGGNCFGEEWIQLGSLTEPRGGIGFVGPVSNTHTTYNNKIDKGIYVGMFQEGLETPGQALLRGKLYMYNVFGSDYWVEYHYRVFTVLGDPSIHIWKEVPQEVEVDHVSSVNVGYNNLDFSVNYVDSGDPVVNGELCITGENVFITGYTDENGEVSIEFYPDMAENLVVTVRGHDVIPYQDAIEVFHEGEHVEPFGDPEILDLNGNENGYINPGEYADLYFTLKNYGSSTASNVEAILVSPDEELVEVLTENPVNFGNLESGEEQTGTAILLTVSTDCSVGQVIPMELQISSSSNSWTYDYMLEITGCMLESNSFVVYDEASIPMNFRMDPGETVKLILAVDNYGDDVAPNVHGMLSSSDPYITILDGDGSFGTINSGAEGVSNVNYFQLSVDAACPEDYWAAFSLDLNTEEGVYAYETTLDIQLPVSSLIPADYSGPDEYGYYAYSSDDAFYEHTPEYDWTDISGIGNSLNMPNQTDYTKDVDLPFEFKYYGINYDELRISTDGWMAFGPGSQVAPENSGLPANDNVSAMVAVFWDDLVDEELEGNDIYTYHDVSNHRFIIQWDSVMHNFTSGEPDHETFQAVLLDPEYYTTTTGDGELILLYKSIEAIEEMTLGIENADQDVGLQYVFNSDYHATAHTLHDACAIKFTTEPPFLSITVSDEELGYWGSQAAGMLRQNLPNPFVGTTRITYVLPESGSVELNIYDIRGELIRCLHSGDQPAGKYTIEWDGKDAFRREASPGLYMVQLKTDDHIATKKMYRLK